MASLHTTYIPLPCDSGGWWTDRAALLSQVPIHIVSHESQLPNAFLHPSPKSRMVIGFDSEGVGLSRMECFVSCSLLFQCHIFGRCSSGGKKLMNACKPALESAYITKVIHDCKRGSEALYFQFGIKLHNVEDTQIAYYLMEEQDGRKRSPVDYISFVGLLADPRCCGSKVLGIPTNV